MYNFNLLSCRVNSFFYVYLFKIENYQKNNVILLVCGYGFTLNLKSGYKMPGTPVAITLCFNIYRPTHMR